MSVFVLCVVVAKSAAILAVALLIVAMLRGRPAADKAAILRWALIASVLVPVLSAVLPTVSVEATFMRREGADVVADGLQAPRVAFDCMAIAAMIYVAGVVVGLLRLVASVAIVSRWIAYAESVTSPAWQRAISSTRGVRLLVSPQVSAPISFGWARPVIVIDRASALRDEAARPVLAHELAHIARGDWAWTMASTIAAILFWFNPLVWVAKRAAEHFAEEAVDQRVLADVSATTYAEVLLDYARTHQIARPAALAVAESGASLKRRMRIILSGVVASKARVPLAFITGATLLTAAALAVVQVVSPAAAIAAVVHAPTPNLVATQETPAHLPASPISVRTAAVAPLADRSVMQDLLSVSDNASPQLVDEPSAAPASAAETQQRARWAANMERHDQRNARRADERERRQRALANRLTALEQTPRPGAD